MSRPTIRIAGFVAGCAALVCAATAGAVPRQTGAPVQPVPALPAPPPATAPPTAAAPPPQSAPPQRQATSALSGCKVSELGSASLQEVSRPNAQGAPERITVLTGPVKIDCDDMQFFADFAQINRHTNRVDATGNVTFVSGRDRISADRMEFDTQTRLGTFYNANGITSLGERADRSLFGTQEPDAFFWGREIHKIGPEKYEVVGGGFTTCTQPTPRWTLASGKAVVKLDDYALIRNMIFKVKGVPLMYLPFMYYPIQDDDRATGFVLPTYGTSTYRGQTISNGFFWAMGRSHDLFLEHHWYSKTGQGYGGEYRYNMGNGSAGNLRTTAIRENASGTDGGGASGGSRSYQVVGGLSQRLGLGLQARANADYFSSLLTQQLYQQDLYAATQRTRRFGANVSGNWSEYVLSATLDRNDYFYGDSDITTNGGLPRISVSRGERAIGKTPIYLGVNGEYASILWSTARNDVTVEDRGLTRIELNPVIRIPFTRWQFLGVNSSVSWRATRWSESLVDNPDTPDLTDRIQAPEPIGRQFFDFSSRITGPVLTRIFDRPGSTYATRLKHVIEPTFTIQRVTAIDNFVDIVKIDGADYTVGSMTRFSYGLNNRLYAKKDTSREILSMAITQSYYTNPDAARFDRDFQSAAHNQLQDPTTTKPTNYSPVAVTFRGSPTDRVQGEFRTEWDTTFKTLRTLAAAGSVNGTHLQASAGWSRRLFIPGLSGFDNLDFADHYINASANWRSASNRVGAVYSFNYDLRRDSFLQQRYLAYYNAQCCGINVEYQTFNFAFRGASIPQDRRFNISFTLAGVGTFANFLGAFGGTTGQ